MKTSKSYQEGSASLQPSMLLLGGPFSQIYFKLWTKYKKQLPQGPGD